MNEEVVSNIVEIGISYFGEVPWSKANDTRALLALHMRQYVTGRIPYSTIESFCAQNLGTSQPLEQLKEIIEMSQEPIPESAEVIQDEDQSASQEQMKRKKSRPWTPYEDQRLIAGIMKHGIENWTSISRFVGNSRTRSQCSQRWMRGLDPKISKNQWTPQEEELLIELINLNGNKAWTTISMQMRNRSDVQCRYKYRQLIKEKRIPAPFGLDQDTSPKAQQQQQQQLHQLQQKGKEKSAKKDEKKHNKNDQNIVNATLFQPIDHQNYMQMPYHAMQGNQQMQLQQQRIQQHLIQIQQEKQGFNLQKNHYVPPMPIQQSMPNIIMKTAPTAMPTQQANPTASNASVPQTANSGIHLPHVQPLLSTDSPFSPPALGIHGEPEKENHTTSEHVDIYRHSDHATPEIETPSFNAKLYSVY